MTKILLWLGVLFSKEDRFYEVKVAVFAIIALLFSVWFFYALNWLRKAVRDRGIASVYAEHKMVIEGWFIVAGIASVILIAVSIPKWLN